MAKFVSTRNLRFMVREIFKSDQLADHDRFRDHTPKMVDMVLDEAVRLAASLMVPVRDEMDKKPPELIKGEVRVHPAVKKIMTEFGRGGWIAAGFPAEHGGDQLPFLVRGAVSFIFAAANYSASAYPELTAGAAELITSFGSKALIDTYVPRMLEGRWQGTMALTEPHAGSSLSDITTTAYRTQNGWFRIKGVKTFISAGDHDGVENIIHLMLAKIEGAPEGAKGISLFVVPKKRPEPDGSLVPNDITAASIYHKLGYRGTPAAELSMGEKDDCQGWLVGEENKGLSHMFQMMNEARILVGLASAAIASAAYYAALDYAENRRQGRPVTMKDPSTDQIPIIDHADVKRMLLFQRSVVDGSLGLILQCCHYADMMKISEGKTREKYTLLLDLLTPVAKAYPSEQGFLAANTAIQCFGGYGYCEDFPVEQFLRDVRIHAIHEGTTGIQGMDLLGRKLLMKDGKAAFLLAEEVKQTIRSASGIPDLTFCSDALAKGMKTLEKTVTVLITVAGEKGPDTFLADATLFLELFSRIIVAWQWLIQGIGAQAALGKGASGKEADFYTGKLYTMNFFFRYELPKIYSLAERLTDGDHLTIEINPNHFKD